jgi:hypothetical protein
MGISRKYLPIIDNFREMFSLYILISVKIPLILFLLTATKNFLKADFTRRPKNERLFLASSTHLSISILQSSSWICKDARVPWRAEPPRSSSLLVSPWTCSIVCFRVSSSRRNWSMVLDADLQSWKKSFSLMMPVIVWPANPSIPAMLDTAATTSIVYNADNGRLNS